MEIFISKIRDVGIKGERFMRGDGR